MAEKVKILAVAPYEGLSAILEREARSYDNLSMTIVVGNLEEGVAAAIDQLVEPFDLVLSRGGTADLLREQLDLPIVDIKTSQFDVLQAVRFSEEIQGKKAVVGFPGITDAARATSDVLQLGLDIFTIVTHDDVPAMVEPLRREGYTTILCDVISSTVFRESGFNTVLITSGQSSVRESIDEAVRIARHVRHAHEEGLYFREVLSHSGVETVIFHESDALFFSTLDQGGNKALIDYLRELLPEVRSGQVQSARKTIAGNSYAIRSFFDPSSEGKVAFFLSRSRSQGAARQAGISYYTKRQAHDDYLDNPFSLSGTVASLGSALEDAIESGRPLLFTGEYGTGRTIMASYAYMNSPLAAHPLVEIDCGMLTDRSKDYLLTSRTSPLFDSGLTIHIKNMGASDAPFINDLFTTLVDTNAAHRNFLVFSCNPRGELVNSYIPFIKDRFQCIEFELRPLRENKERITTLTRLYLNQLSADLPTEAKQIDRQAAELLAAYAWPGNYVQFKRILSQLCIVSRDRVIRAADVRSLLSLERPSYRDVESHDEGYGLDLGRTLSDIERDIIDIVMRQNGGNQSAAARQLGISRTTLWRLLKSS